MRARAFIVEDYCTIAWQAFLSDLNIEYTKKNKIFESHDGDELLQFINLHTELPKVGQAYYFITAMWLTDQGSRFISLAKSDELYTIIAIEHNGRLLVENNITKKRRSFPEVAGPVTSNVQSSVLFDDLNSRDQFMLLFTLKFGHWHINTKEL